MAKRHSDTDHTPSRARDSEVRLVDDVESDDGVIGKVKAAVLPAQLELSQELAKGTSSIGYAGAVEEEKLNHHCSCCESNLIHNHCGCERHPIRIALDQPVKDLAKLHRPQALGPVFWKPETVLISVCTSPCREGICTHLVRQFSCVCIKRFVYLKC